MWQTKEEGCNNQTNHFPVIRNLDVLHKTALIAVIRSTRGDCKMDDNKTNSGVGTGFMADMLKDLQKQYGYYSRPLE